MKHRAKDPTTLQSGDLVSVHLVGPAGREGFFTGEVTTFDDGPPVVVIEGTDASDGEELARLRERNDQLQAELREARAEIERCRHAHPRADDRTR